MKQRVWVVAGNRNEFDSYVRNKPLNGDKKYHYVQSAEYLRGVRNPHGVFIGSWKHRDDIIQILDQLIISTSDNTDKLYQIKIDLIRNATAAVIHSSAVSNASQLLSNAIDQEILDQLIGNKPMTWKGFVK